MRLRITRQPSGCIDGIRLDDFIVGFVYDVGTTLACFLLAEGVAEPVSDDTPAHVPPVEVTRFTLIKPAQEPDPAENPKAGMLFPRTHAADRPSPRRKKR